jgi:hypothetical protein
VEEEKKYDDEEEDDGFSPPFEDMFVEMTDGRKIHVSKLVEGYYVIDKDASGETNIVYAKNTDRAVRWSQEWDHEQFKQEWLENIHPEPTPEEEERFKAADADIPVLL